MPRTPHIPEPGSRRWHVPPPLVRGGAALEGANILQEVPGELGILLWQSVRTVTLWASARPSDRSELFLPGAEERRAATLEAIEPEPEVREPLRAITALLGRPLEIEPTVTGVACTQVAQWAQSKGLRATGFEFTQAAALASPQDPKLALTVARTARNGAEYSGAEVWYQRTVGLARQAGDWDTYARAYIGLGKMWLARGVYPAARKNLHKARRAAERKGLNDVLGMALHDLFAVESESHRDAEALRYAQDALHAYPRGDANLPALAYDVAFFWVPRGQFEQALPVLRAVLPHLDSERAEPHGGLARAAGAMGDKATFESAWQALWKMGDDAPGKANALVEASRGAASLGRWVDAERAASHALEIARQRRQSKVVLDAEGVLESVRNERSADTALRQAEPAAAGKAPPADPADVLARELVESLEASSAGRQVDALTLRHQT